MEATLFKSTFAGLLCEGGWLALLLCQLFGTQSPSALKNTQGFREQARIHMKANGSERAIAQILALPVPVQILLPLEKPKQNLASLLLVMQKTNKTPGTDSQPSTPQLRAFRPVSPVSPIAPEHQKSN
jgi:hypothetical protein